MKILLAILIIVIAFYFHQKRERAPLSTDVLSKEYDFVIVGGGTAGCIVASRLSEDPSVSVLLLEAGDDDRNKPNVHIPGASGTFFDGKEMWMDKTLPQKHACFGNLNNQCSQPHGKILGGGSSVNSMMYVRGSPHDYDTWAKNGATGWSYKDVLPYFKKAETMDVPRLQNSEFHGYDGPIVLQERAWSDISKAWMEAAKELDLVANDTNSNEQEGLSLTQQNVNNGVRSNMPSGYLESARSRTNLHVLTRAFVNKILIHKKVANGVEFLWKGEKRIVSAKKEVIVSAGALDSPKVLMLSGIGHKEHLQQYEIPVIADLPVGDNLQDHLLVETHFTVENAETLTPKRATSFSTMINYVILKAGPLGSSYLEAQAHFRPPSQPKDSLIPHGQHMVFSVLINNRDDSRDILKKCFNIREEIMELGSGKRDNIEGFTVLPALIHPESKGTVRLASNLPSDRPLIDPHYLEHPQDIKVMLDAIRFAQKVTNTTAFAKMGTKLLTFEHPYCSHHGFDSDAFWECVIRHDSKTVFHPAGTCKMGAESDSTTVVDAKLRVKGIKGLRVIDASIMPHVTAANTMAPTIMIAEKGADLIKEDYKLND